MTRVLEAVVLIQRGYKRWKLKYGDPKKIVKVKNEKAFFI